MRIGFDIGGTKTEVCLLSHSGNTIFSHRVSTPNSYDSLVQLIAELTELTESQHGKSASIGLGLPGSVSATSGLVQNANCTFLNGKNFKADLEKRLNRRVNLANDANCFALSEAIDGAGKGAGLVFGAILGTGCGGGIVVNQKLLVGPNSLCGEWGHNPLPGYSKFRDGSTRACYCGKQNCIETFISGTGFQNSYQKMSGQQLNAHSIMDKVQSGDKGASSCYQLLVDQMARSFAALINILDPEVIVLGGGLSNVITLYEDLPKATAQYVFSNNATLRFAQAQYGDSSGIRGAAWLGL